MSQSRMAVITFIDGGPVDPGFGGGLPGGGYPSHGLPISPGHPGNALPGFPGFPVQLPVYPFDPTIDNSLPGSGARPDQGLPPSPGRPDQGLPPSPGRPDQGLPPSPGRPSQPIHDIRPGMRFMVKWLVCGGLILVPDNELPGQGGEIDNTLPPTAQPKK